MNNETLGLSRRRFLACATASMMSAAAAPGQKSSTRSAAARGIPFEIEREPDDAAVFCGIESRTDLTRRGEEWRAGDIVLQLSKDKAATSIVLSAPSIEPTHVRLRWKGSLPVDARILGDAWERSYGDLAWQGCRAERCLPWYAAISADDLTFAYGVLCGASAFAFWQVDTAGLTLWLDVRNGGSGVRLGQRALHVASVTSMQGKEGESALRMLTRFCALLSPRPRPRDGALIGTNDWYYAYGNNTAAGIERDADFITSLMPSTRNKPFTIVDDGWTNLRAFPDIRALADKLRGHGVRPGLWVRPLQAKSDTAPNLLLPDARYGATKERAVGLAFDPTIPEALQLAVAKVEQATAWGYELVKHDFSTYELFGQWGSEMGASVTLPGWSFNDRSLTNAEIVLHLYRSIRRSAGESTWIIGCNTVGHLAAGLFEANRTGDDVSGREWERTRRMGVNTLAFRLPQNKTFFLQDADCVPLTRAVSWRHTAQWLDAVARSGSALIISAEPGALGPEQKQAVRDALQAALATASAEPLDWQENTTPEHWRFDTTGPRDYPWSAPDGASPFSVT
jgi:alpha-galactosidase